ncbi:hypothetical protein BDF20DRAFT_812771 [Mycotypha africana]|uniref:uncharacterized protein n=1 Tax=Mycotypha africana TaxID=64632 RepID=UPI002301457F|nr:uncharacterized protein BDF20DRAFT_812771 [Mycotypha africana]KAI8991683.1 hypothetical protein BDF20DRAFT_812771 [Mycotypha africana]
MKLLYLLLPFLTFNTFTYCQLFNYHGLKYPKNKLYPLEAETIGLKNIDGTVAAFGDFNGDKFTDIFVLSADQTSVSIYRWNHGLYQFQPLPNLQPIQPGFIITNVVPGDYNHDGFLDVLLMGEDNPESNSGREIKLQLYFGNGNDTIETNNAIHLPSAYDSLPIVLDVNGDMKTDILGYAFETKELSVWLNQAAPKVTTSTAQEEENATNTQTEQNDSLFNLTPAHPLLDKSYTDRCHWANPHSNAFIDLDGDCLADLLFVCSQSNSNRQFIQIWTNDRQRGFQISQEAELPEGAGPLSFADMDGDGSIDIVFPVCIDNVCTLHIVYNQQMHLCGSDMGSNSDSCRQSQHLCQADPNFEFDFSRPNTQNYVVFNLDAYLDQNEAVRMKDGSFRGQLSVQVHVGDYNLDGYPDALVTTTERVLLLQSIPCDSTLCNTAAEERLKRTFTVVTTGAEVLNEIGNPTQAVFFDIDEDGSLDILLLDNSEKRSDLKRTPNFIVNNFFNDAFFLKGLVSNGASDFKAYGVNYPGASIKFTVLDTNGHKKSRQVAQLSQTAYLSLQTPYCLFGLGRTNNYIEELFAGITRHQEQNYFFYEGVIPNSQLVFLPYQPDHIRDSSSWRVELYIKPAKYVPWVLIVLVVTSVILGVVVVVLRSMEKKEDEMERRKALHIINFDAL